MPFVNDASQEIQFKLVFWGPPWAGKGSTLAVLHEALEPERRGELTTFQASADRTLAFEYAPAEPVLREGYQTRFVFYTVPGPVTYNATRELVLRGADGVVFVADTDPERWEANGESWRRLGMTLQDLGRERATLPIVIQCNKQDLAGAVSIPQLRQGLGVSEATPTVGASALSGEGVLECVDRLSTEILERFHAGESLEPETTPALEGEESAAEARQRRKPLEASSW